MTTALFTHAASLEHATPPGHPEQIARMQVIEQALAEPAFDGLLRLEAPLAEDSAILRCHPQRYLDKVRNAIPSEGYHALDGDTHVMRGSLGAGLRAAGGAVAAVDAVLDGTANNAFVATRPPGHHAETETAMGFCLFGNVAIAAKHALDVRGLERVVVVDFDVHHGNGTQDLLWDEERAPFISTHQSPLYPGSGMRNERGAHGQILNLPLPPGTDGPAYRAVFESKVLPAVRAARPQLILVSAGFDAHMADPLAQMDLRTEDYSWIAGQLCDLSEALCDGRLVSCLEGGYDLPALAESVADYISVMMERSTDQGA